MTAARVIDRCMTVTLPPFDEPWLAARVAEAGDWDGRRHRKHWEHAVIRQTYLETIGRGGRALGFGIGRERTPAWLAARGAEVVATDLGYGDERIKDWAGAQHLDSDDDLPWREICTEEQRRQITLRAVDMANLPDDLLRGEFDFTWSTGSFEHIGGLEAGARFFLRQMRALRLGGVAAHTTEFNLASEESTIDASNLCVYRRRDIEWIRDEIARQGDELWPVNLRTLGVGAGAHIDIPPDESDPHLAVKLGNGAFVATSILLVATRRGGGR